MNDVVGPLRETGRPHRRVRSRTSVTSPKAGSARDHGRTETVVLPRPRRVNRPADFRRVLRRGRKCGRRRLVVHAHRLVPTAIAGETVTGDDAQARAGLVVGRGVGPAVVRHRVSRRLRHLLAARLDLLPPGTDLVVRAQAPAADATSAELGDDLDEALRRLGLVGAAR